MNAPFADAPRATLTPTEKDPRWARVVARDSAADGVILL